MYILIDIFDKEYPVILMSDELPVRFDTKEEAELSINECQDGIVVDLDLEKTIQEIIVEELLELQKALRSNPLGFYEGTTDDFITEYIRRKAND